MLRRGVSAPVFGAALIAGLFLIAPRVAQAQASVTYSTLQSSNQPARKPAAKPAKPAPAAAQPYTTVNPAEQSDFWTVNASVGSQYAKPQAKSADRPRGAVPSETTPLDRVKLRDAPGGSIGFASGQSARSGQFSDGRDVPGLTANTQKESSYVGMSLSVSSGSKGLPLPLPGPVYGRPE